MTRIIIQVGDESFAGTLDENSCPQTVRAILSALPITSTVRTWGDEIYFEIPVAMGPENAVEVVHVGDLGYWPEGRCFCIFFGKTPMSRSADAIIPASAVNPIGTVENPLGFKKHGRGEKVVVKLAE